jgi:hypothetical protein
MWKEGTDVLRLPSFWHDAEYCASIQDILMRVNCLLGCMTALLRDVIVKCMAQLP